MPRAVHPICLTVLLLFAAASHADPPKSIFGVYVHLSRVCGGPGSADGPVDCGLVFEDRLTITARSTENAQGSASVSFAVRNKYMDACLFIGQGTWSNGQLVLSQTEKPTDVSCRLTISFSKAGARLSDPADKCRPGLCFGSGRKLDGVLFKKERDQ